jgi:immune inhibitor A
MLNGLDLLRNYLRIREAVKATEDGQRCAVAPHPDLREKLQEEMKRLRASDALAAPFVKISEPTYPGLNDGMIVPPDEFPLGTPLSVVRSAAADRAPLRGTVRVIVVLVDFSDKPMTATTAHFKNLFFSTGVIATGSVREYYKEVTHGLIDIQGEVVGPFRMPKKLSEYAHGASGMGGTAPNAQTMARDAAVAANPSVNFTPYDNDGNGYVDAFIVVHAGSGAEQTGNVNDIWSHKWVLSGGAYAADATKIYGYLTIPEDAKIGVCAHELGHLLFGFPDLYDTDNSSEGIGNWCLMAAGSWGGGGDTPCHPSAWCKANQGWVSVTNRTTNGTLSIPDVKSSLTVYRLWKDGTAGSEYFLLENRQRTGFDKSLPGDGLLIWHIDDSVSSNTNESHYKVALMQADGKKDLEHGSNRGDSGDSFPGASGNTSFADATNPNSKSYANSSTCVAVTGITPSSPTMTANVQVKCKGKELKDIKELKELHKEVFKDVKDSHKEHKEKEIKEKELHKELQKELIKDLTDHGGKRLGKEVEKPVTDKGAGFEKPFDNPGGGGGGGLLGGGGGAAGPMAGASGGDIESRLSMIEQALGQLLGQGQGQGGVPQQQPFIGQELRPDLSQGAYSGDPGGGQQLQRQMMAAAMRARRLEGNPG